jgi:hypothetical protein
VFVEIFHFCTFRSIAMAAVPDLTINELVEKITDEAVADWWGAVDALPSGVSLSELLAKTLQAAAVAQIAKNAAAAPEAGEALNSYPLPTTGTVQTDVENNLQFFESTYTLSVVSNATLDTSVPAYV